MAPTDGALAARWQQGDREAFGSLYGRHRRTVYMYLCAMLGNRAAAEDLLQDTFVALITHIRRIRVAHHDSLAPYLLTVARNKAADWLRRHRCEARVMSDIALCADDASRARNGLTPQEASELIWQLPPEQRESVILRIYCGLTFAEIAAVTDAPLGTAVSRYRYALEKLRSVLKEDDHGIETNQ